MLAATMTRPPSELDVQDAEARFAETGDPLYIALAIGSLPHQPPRWAVEEAIKLRELAAVRTAKGYNPDADGELLDDMVRTFFAIEDVARDKEGYSASSYRAPSLDQVIRAVLLAEGLQPGSAAFAARSRALRRRWEEEASTVRGEEMEPCGVPATARYRRLLGEWGDNQQGL